MDRTPDNMGRPVPANETNDEWDGMWDCPDCGDRTGNMVNHDEPLKDCLDHIEDGDLREYTRKTIAQYKTWFGIKDKRIFELETKIAELQGQIDAFILLVAKKDDQINELLEAVKFLTARLNERGKP